MGILRPVAALAACVAVVSCAPTNLPMEVAEAQCVQYALDGGSSVTVGMAAGTGGGWGNGGWGGWGPGWGYGGGSGVGVGVSAVTELPDGRSPAQIYASCVQRRSGMPPVTPFNQRPEIKG